MDKLGSTDNYRRSSRLDICVLPKNVLLVQRKEIPFYIFRLSITSREFIMKRRLFWVKVNYGDLMFSGYRLSPFFFVLRTQKIKGPKELCRQENPGNGSR